MTRLRDARQIGLAGVLLVVVLLGRLLALPRGGSAVSRLLFEAVVLGLPLCAPWLMLLVIEGLLLRRDPRPLSFVEVVYCLQVMLYQVALFFFLPDLWRTLDPFVLIWMVMTRLWAVSAVAALVMIAVIACGRYSSFRMSTATIPARRAASSPMSVSS